MNLVAVAKDPDSRDMFADPVECPPAGAALPASASRSSVFPKISFDWLQCFGLPAHRPCGLGGAFAAWLLRHRLGDLRRH